jgi:putative FmdB family regulatory protein
MPVYEYACEKCGHELEAEQRITDPPLKTCPRCKARKLKRLISQTSFVLKGGGWYADLYASKSSKEKDAGETNSDAPAAKSEAAGGPQAGAAGVAGFAGRAIDRCRTTSAGIRPPGTSSRARLPARSWLPAR